MKDRIGKISFYDFHVHTRTTEIFPLLEEAAGLRISRMNILGDVLRFGYYPEKEQVKQINDETGYLIKRYRCLTGFAFINPGLGEKLVIAEIERCAGLGFRGIKLEVSVNARDRRVRVVMETARRLNMIVVHHSWYKATGKSGGESEPADLVPLAEAFPEVPLVVAHLRGCGFRGIQDLKPYPQVYFDTSGSQPVAGILEYAVEQLGPERILFGSDVYFPGGRDFSVQLACVR
ncbi:MAG TPA: amidohydrolase family protein, partial [bacterium]|nr:amidohydrolase family protein [bacterium]